MPPKAAHMQHNRCTTPPYETSHAPEPGAHLYGIGHADLTGRQAQACERFELEQEAVGMEAVRGYHRTNANKHFRTRFRQPGGELGVKPYNELHYAEYSLGY